MRIEISRDLPKRKTDFSWQKGISNCHAYLLHRKDVLKQIKLAHDELGFRYLRCHGIFDDDMLTYQRMGDCRMFAAVPGKNRIVEVNFRQIGDIYDNLLECGVRPFVELSFMPSALTSGKKLGLAYNPNITMPKDLNAWSEHICRFIRFLIDRYGKEEVEEWYFEVWNEPDLGAFFAGTQEDYFRLYDATAKAVKSVDKDLRVGGPSTSGCKWIPEFLDHCRKNHVPCDFVTTHHYPGDAFGNFVTLSNIRKMYSASRNAVKTGKDLSDTMRDMFFLPEDAKRWEKGTLAKMDRKAKEQCGDMPLFISEWNSMAVFGSPVHDEKYSAAFAVKSCLDLDNRLESYMFWCCSDIYEEQFMLQKPFVGGFGIVSNDGIPKPNFWGFKMLSQLYPERIELFGDEKLDLGVFTNGNDVQILLTPQSGDYYENVQYELEFSLDLEASSVTVQRIDDTHCNPKRIWEEKGRPSNLRRSEVEEIMERSRLVEEEHPFVSGQGRTEVKVECRTNDVVLITVTAKEQTKETVSL